MSERYSKVDLRKVAAELVEELRESEDKTDITTCRLLDKAGFDVEEFDYTDLFEIHDALFKISRENHITLDMSSHKGKVEGLPYNLDFIVHNKKARIKCPHCGSRNTARYIYGYPLFDKRMQEKLDTGKWVLGGCCVNIVEVNGETVNMMPSRKCNECKKDFGKPPIIISRKKNLIEDYRDIVTSIYFSVGGYLDGYTDITIKKNKTGALVNVQYPFNDKEKPDPKQITLLKWRKIVNRLYSDLYIHEWKKNYVDPGVLDGTQWKLTIKLSNGRKRSYYGSNDYSPYWNELLKLFSRFVKE